MSAAETRSPAPVTPAWVEAAFAAYVARLRRQHKPSSFAADVLAQLHAGQVAP